MVRDQFALNLDGIHGTRHWARVRENGLRLARANGARAPVVELFALLHDSKRQSDGQDPDHGRRGARWARELNLSIFTLSRRDLDLLVEACRDHSFGHLDAPVTVQTCWDADRLDLGRIGIRPDPRHLCTPAARDPAVIEWALRRSQARE